jgi:hypothetical protein
LSNQIEINPSVTTTAVARLMPCRLQNLPRVCALPRSTVRTTPRATQRRITSAATKTAV